MTGKKIVGRIFVALFIIVLILVTLAPMLWVVMSSFKTSGELMLRPWSLPSSLQFKNYIQAWKAGNFASYFINSIIVTMLSLIMMILLSSMAAFGLSRYKTRFNKATLLYLLFGQMISAAMVIFPLVIILRSTGLQDTYIGLSLVYTAGGLPFAVYVMTNFFKTVPDGLFEAAKIDGCSEPQMFIKIALPLIKSGIATVFLYQFMWVWNEFTIGFTLIKSSSMRTLPVGLYTTVFGVLQTNYVVAFAGTVIVSLPTVIIYLIFQKYLVKGLTAGAIKA